MAPLENGGFQQSVWDGERRQPIDSLMRALLYIAQQVGRPVSEADIRRLAAVPVSGLDEGAFLTAGTRLGLEAYAVDLAARRLDDLPTPFALVGASDQPAPHQPASRRPPMSWWPARGTSGPCSMSSRVASGVWRPTR